LDDQPTDGDASLLGVDEPSLLQGAQQNHGAGDRQRQPEDQIGAEFPAKAQASAIPSKVATAICTSAPGIAMARTERRSCKISASSAAIAGSATKPGV
jgi:hypothetical protein